MSDPYGPTFPPPSFMAPQEAAPTPTPGLLTRLRRGAFVVAPVAGLVVMVGVLAVVIYRGEHPRPIDSDSDQRANVSTYGVPGPLPGSAASSSQ
ncbi:hypothetical protein [Nocardia heshunensis]